MALKQRKEADVRFTWNFSDIFENDAAWEAAYAEAEAALATIPPIQGTLGESAERMKEGLDTLFAVEQKVELLYVYSMLRQDQSVPSFFMAFVSVENATLLSTLLGVVTALRTTFP